MTLLYFLLILGVTVLVHEFGHYLLAKKAGIYVYEFSIGMGKKIWGFKRKNDETEYNLRLIPIGGYVRLAGEEIEDDKKIPAKMKLQAKTWWQRFWTIVSGALFNFLAAFILLFLIGIFYGANETRPYIGEVYDNYPASLKGVETGDLILKIDGEKMKTWDDVLLHLELVPDGKVLIFELEKNNGDIKRLSIAPKKVIEDDTEYYKYGFGATTNKNYGFVASLNYAIIKFGAIINSMFAVIINLITGSLSFNSIAGPVGIYNLVGEGVSSGFVNVLYLMAFISINVGFINLLPFPAFDGGRVIFLIIEKIKGSKVDPRIENIIHGIGFMLLILLMLIITIQDIKRLF